ncbi:DUF4864 domain-containing protein [Aurantimonas sp. MSK8Z-1]|uniref:DUF4864 domain-containing protein n=1 Tax=Mangrovibrevibacter kandeliae TaxID=2968473 RepID=UPI00211930E1|nr:DUF4864 domain-containing protein [Aurantimonas sp. MSK8Z-1]MCW4116911.1 DUF4864 domain-containing protein [Aurantimonas sp. MSK8Z-1]
MRLIAALLLALIMPLAAAAQSPTDDAAIRAAIERQLEAFSSDDGAAAWSYAAPSIQQRFPTPDAFMALVEQAYPPVYRSRSHSFGDLAQTPLGLAQRVEIVDGDGVAWDALYTVEEQPDGSWKITGCYLAKKAGVTA